MVVYYYFNTFALDNSMNGLTINFQFVAFTVYIYYLDR